MRLLPYSTSNKEDLGRGDVKRDTGRVKHGQERGCGHNYQTPYTVGSAVAGREHDGGIRIEPPRSHSCEFQP